MPAEGIRTAGFDCERERGGIRARAAGRFNLAIVRSRE